jgi:hypothetical protein
MLRWLYCNIVLPKKHFLKVCLIHCPNFNTPLIYIQTTYSTWDGRLVSYSTIETQGTSPNQVCISRIVKSSVNQQKPLRTPTLLNCACICGTLDITAPRGVNNCLMVVCWHNHVFSVRCSWFHNILVKLRCYCNHYPYSLEFPPKYTCS